MNEEVVYRINEVVLNYIQRVQLTTPTDFTYKFAQWKGRESNMQTLC